MTVTQRLRRHPYLFVLAIGIGFTLEAADRIIFGAALGEPIEFEEPMMFAFNALLTALPFLVLSTLGKQHIVPWAAGIIFSVVITWWWLEKGIAYQRNPDGSGIHGSGIDIAGALIMLLSPFVITAICLVLSWHLERWKAHGN